MKSNLSKYFWDLNESALKEARAVLRNPDDPKFNRRLIALLSRCDRPAELFSFLPRDTFVRVWPRVKKEWRKAARESDFREWWETIYQQLLSDKKPPAPGQSPALLKQVGKSVRAARLEKGWSQKDLALRVGMKQPDVSRIEEGRTNTTFLTLALLGKALDLKSIQIS